MVITDRIGRSIVAVELDDRSHQSPKRQRRDLLLEEVLKQGVSRCCVAMMSSNWLSASGQTFARNDRRLRHEPG